MSVHPSRRFILAAGAAALAAPTVLRAQTPAIKIGMIHPVTGALSFGGQMCRLGGLAAIDDINREGGVKALGGARIEPILGDAQGRPEIGASLVDQMAEQGVVGFTGCFSSPIALAATQAAAKYNLPFSIDAGLADSLTGRGLKNVYRLFPNVSQTSRGALAALDAINKGAGSPAKTAMIVHEDSEFGTGTAKFMTENLSKIGIKVIDTIAHATPTRDFTNVVLKIKAGKPDIVIPSSYNNEYVLFVRTLVQQKVDLAAIYSIAGGGFNLRFAREQPQNAENILDFNHWYNPRSPKAQAFASMFESKGSPFSFENLFGYFAMRFLVDGLERAASTDREKVNEVLATSTFGSDLLTYAPTKLVNGQNLSAQATMQQIQGGDIKVVWPDEYASAKLVFPRRKNI